jgi:hypothetical protein
MNIKALMGSSVASAGFTTLAVLSVSLLLLCLSIVVSYILVASRITVVNLAAIKLAFVVFGFLCLFLCVKTAVSAVLAVFLSAWVLHCAWMLVAGLPEDRPVPRCVCVTLAVLAATYCATDLLGYTFSFGLGV